VAIPAACVRRSASRWTALGSPARPVWAIGSSARGPRGRTRTTAAPDIATPAPAPMAHIRSSISITTISVFSRDKVSWRARRPGSHHPVGRRYLYAV